MTIDELEQLISNLTWEDFEKTDWGELTIGYVPPHQKEPIFIKFCMRVGLHMNRPFQAVIAVSQYVRLRAAPQYTGYKLHRLNASHPSGCWYTPRIRAGSESRPLWKPEDPEGETTTWHSYTTSYQANWTRIATP